MSFVSRILSRPRAAVTSSRELQKLLEAQHATDSGAVVTTDSAMRVAAVWACVRVLSETLASVPLILYERTKTGKRRAPEHWAYRLLHEQPNAWQTPYGFKETLQANLVPGGNGYAIKTVVGTEVQELLPVAHHRVTIQQDELLRVAYLVTMPDGSTLPVPQERMFHLVGFSFDGLRGVSPIAYHREAIGLTMQLVQHGARLFKQGASVRGVLEHPARLTKEAYDRLKASFDETYAGVEQAHKTAILEEGVKYSKIAMTADEAQFLESRKYQRTEIAGIFRVPPHLIGDLERATFTNVEHQSLEFVKFSMTPWFVRWEEQITRSIIPPRDRARFFAEFLVDGLLRGDQKSRYDAYRTAITTGWMSRNEARVLENMDPQDGLDEFLTPLNMAAGDEPAPDKKATAA